jgi:hypothetical protein
MMSMLLYIRFISQVPTTSLRNAEYVCLLRDHPSRYFNSMGKKTWAPSLNSKDSTFRNDVYGQLRTSRDTATLHWRLAPNEKT